MKRIVIVTALLLSTLSLFAALPPLIPRKVLWGNPERTSPQISPDGKRIAWLAPDAKGVLNVWARPIDKDEPKLLTNETHRPIYWYLWAADGRHILYLQDSDGDENTHLFSADLESRNIRDLTPWRGIRAQNILTSPRKPNEVLVGMNLRDRSVFDMYRVDLTTGATTLEVQNQGDVLTWSTDNDFVIRGATVFDPKTAESIIRVRDGRDQPWRNLVLMPFERALFDGEVFGGSLIAGFAPDNRSIIIHTAMHSDHGRLERIDLASGKTLEVLAEDPHSDVDEEGGPQPGVIIDPKNGAIQAVKFNYLEPRWQFLDPSLKNDFDAIGKVTPGFLRLISRDSADRTWIVATFSPSAPVTYYSFDRSTKKIDKLFTDNPELTKYQLAEKKPVVIKARDGLELVCYLALPPGVPARNLPLVANIHGGPNFRDGMDYFDPDVQLLTNRGYAVLQVNYRGSTGFGLRYLNLGNKQWGLGMQEDIYDAIQWTIQKKIADPKRIASYGWSGGGLATLRGLEMRPDLFTCGVDGSGPADVATLFRSSPAYWSAALTRWRLRVGDADHDEAWNKKISPLYHADQIRAPLLIIAGANDPRVTLSDIEGMVKALRDAKQEATFIVYPDEGHGLARPENNLDCSGRIEEFLAKYLGGRSEPRTKVEGATGEER